MNRYDQSPANLLVCSFQNPNLANKVCILDADTDIPYSYADMELITSCAASVLISEKIYERDTVSLMLENGPHFFAPWLGAIRIGAIVNPINTLYTPEQMLYALKLCSAKILVAEYKFFYEENGQPKALSYVMQKSYPRLRILLMRAGINACVQFAQHELWGNKFAGAAPHHKIHPGTEYDTFQLICTSGTTGKPKAVVQHNGMFFPNVSDIIGTYELASNDITLLVNRLFHVNAQVANFFPMTLLGGTTVLFNFNRNQPHDFWQAIQRYGATYSSVIPPMLNMIQDAKKLDTPTMRFFIVGADILTPKAHEDFVQKTGTELRPGWGMTETLCWGSGTRAGEVKLASIGKPLPNTQMKVTDPENNWEEMPRGAQGRLIVKGQNVFCAYLNNPEATAEAFAPSKRWGRGWFDTGDTVYEDKDGTFYFVCRASADSWKMRGEFIVGPVLDKYLESHPDVLQAVAVPIMINEQMETVMLVVAKNTNRSMAEKIWQYCEDGRKNGKLEAHYKVNGIIFVDTLELGDTGKRNRKKMQDRLRQHYDGERQQGWNGIFTFSKTRPNV